MSLILSGTDGLSDVDGTAATPAIRGTDANTGIFFGTDIIAFAEGGVEAARFDSSGNLLVGSTSVPSPVANYKALVVGGTTGGIVDMGTTSTSYGRVSADSAGLGVSSLGATTIIFRTDATERARFLAAGGLQTKTTISVGDATPSTSGAGITFPATQSASSNANTLDDYEEGTWSVTVTPGSGGSFTTITTSGTYTKIGRQVSLMLYIDVGNVGTAAGSFDITGFPFVPATTHNYIYGTGANQNTGVAVIFQVFTPGPNTNISPGTGTTLCATGTKVGAQITYFV